uniref:Uncharacterized protein n=1 Tax=Tanacetum cinerariifolium TaxID=118510 RepID=A0A6L2NM85_TANCI|nr:hypothetical protein [Tanacetum cinerariifolium]
MEQYLALNHDDTMRGVKKPEIEGIVDFEIKGQFLKELRDNTFSKNENEDAYEHVGRILEITGHGKNSAGQEIVMKIRDKDELPQKTPVKEPGTFAEKVPEELEETEGLEEFLMNDDINEDLGDFLEENDLLPKIDWDTLEECVGLEVDATEGILRFKINNDRTILNMPRAFNKFTSDEDYYAWELVDYEAETGTTFKLRHCWEILKGSLKWKQSEVPKFFAKSEEGSKRYKSSGSSSDKAKGAMKKKGPRASGSSSTNDEALARLMVSEMATQNKRAIEMHKEERKAYLEIKMRDLECRERELENHES